MKNTVLLLTFLIINSCANDKSNSSTLENNDQNAVSKSQNLTYYGKQISEEDNDDYSKTKELVMQVLYLDLVRLEVWNY